MKQYLDRICASFVLLVALGSSVAAQSQADGSPTGIGVISGRVVDENGQALSNVTVYVFSNAGAKSRTATTDNEGKFQVADLEPALYSVSASAPTYVSSLPDANGRPPLYRIGDSITLTLAKGGVITGTVTSTSGEPLVQIPVRAILISDRDGQKYGWNLGERFTDDRGVYRFYGLAPGIYRVAAGGQSSFQSSGYENAYDRETATYSPSSTLDAASEVVVRAGEETSGVDIRHLAERGHVVTGTVSGPGEPNSTYPRAGVMLTPISNEAGLPSSLRSVQSESEGFSFDNVADGDYEVTAGYEAGPNGLAMSNPQRITVKGADVTGLKLIVKPMGSISGRLALENSTAPECKGKPRPVFAETLLSANNNSKESANNWLRRRLFYLNQVTIDKAGAFSFGYMVAGQYSFNVQIFAKHWYLQAVTRPLPAAQSAVRDSSPAKKPVAAAGNWVSLKSGERITDLAITLAEGAASLQGRVTAAEGESLPGKLFVHLVPAEKDNAEEVLRFYTGTVSDDGAFTIDHVAPGRYWTIARVASESDSRRADLKGPEQMETRRKLLREAETANNLVELRACQSLANYRLQFPSSVPNRRTIKKN